MEIIGKKIFFLPFDNKISNNYENVKSNSNSWVGWLYVDKIPSELVLFNKCSKNYIENSNNNSKNSSFLQKKWRSFNRNKFNFRKKIYIKKKN